jgi:hypothetical protein
MWVCSVDLRPATGEIIDHNVVCREIQSWTIMAFGKSSVCPG